jgi:hypothetical protein
VTVCKGWVSWCQLLFGTLVAIALTVCGRGGPARYDISGAIQFRGKPVPAGTVTFIPNNASAGQQPLGFCSFRDGEFRSRSGRSPGAGSYRVLITGCDGVAHETRLGDIVEQHPLGKNIFSSYAIDLELPARHGGVFDFVIPDAAR